MPALCYSKNKQIIRRGRNHGKENPRCDNCECYRSEKNAGETSMKPTLCFTCIVITMTTLVLVPITSAQHHEPEYTVRCIYFRPNDREPIPNVNEDYDRVMKDIQEYYAEMMVFHGFERKTFKLETDENGKVVVHHIVGDQDTQYYRTHILAEYGVVRKEFDLETSKNIYVIASDQGTFTRDDHLRNYSILGSGNGRSLRGRAFFGIQAITGSPIAPGRYLLPGLIVHEIGHAFGLRHDRYGSRADAVYFPGTESISSIPMSTSFCAAEWLDANRYFNTEQAAQNPFNENTTVSPPKTTLVAPPSKIRFRFDVADPDGLHQMLFYSNSIESVIGCEKLSGKSATVDLITTKLIDSDVVFFQVMDIYGNYKQDRYPVDPSSLPLPPPEVISIPDSNLASVIRERLRLDAGVDITQLDMARLRHLNAHNQQITDLTGLEHAFTMISLDLSNNQIYDITPIAGMTDLIFLYLDGNTIDEVTPLSGLVNLERLTFSENQVSDISAITALTQLTELRIGRNQISNISSLSGLTNLEKLYLYANNINDLTPLRPLINLEELYLFDNRQLSNLTPLSGLVNLVDLSLGGNQISDIKPLQRLTNLNSLMLNSNKISVIPDLSDMTRLRFLHLARNQISDVTHLAGLTQITVLALNYNQITDLTPLAELTTLRNLNLIYNQINALNALSGLTQMKELYLWRNEIRDISPLSGLTQLTSLHLRDNQITDINPLSGLTQLVTLNLIDNQISDVSSLVGLVNLRNLTLFGNPIKNRKPLFEMIRQNPSIKIFLNDPKKPLPVTLSHFQAEITEEGVIVSWTTESEVNNAGFYIYRGRTKDGEFKVVNTTMIKGAGTTGKHNTYKWTDTTAKSDTVYYYRIEDVSHAGERQQLATVRLRGLISARGKDFISWGSLKAD